MVLKMARGQMVIVLLALTVLAPIVLYTDKLGSYIDTSTRTFFFGGRGMFCSSFILLLPMFFLLDLQ